MNKTEAVYREQASEYQKASSRIFRFYFTNFNQSCANSYGKPSHTSSHKILDSVGNQTFFTKLKILEKVVKQVQNDKILVHFVSFTLKQSLLDVVSVNEFSVE